MERFQILTSGRRLPLDEMHVNLNGKMVYLSRSVDQEGEILESYVTRIRDKDGALRYLEKALKGHGSLETITTDGLRSYGAAMRELGNEQKQELGRWAKNPVRKQRPVAPAKGTSNAAVPTDVELTEVRFSPH